MSSNIEERGDSKAKGKIEKLQRKNSEFKGKLMEAKDVLER
jgi:hypothetical protein